MTENRTFDWDDTIEKESEFIKLDPGTYDYTVERVEKSFYNGSEKMSACNLAIVHLNIEGAKIQERLYLHAKSEWKLSEFFISIGLKKKGEKTTMKWGEVPGKTGRLELKEEEYKGEVYMRVQKFLPPQEIDFQAGTF